MSFAVSDTIAAIASARAPGARSIVRLSGPAVADCLRPHFVTDAAWDACQVPTVTSGALRLTSVSADLPCALYFWPTQRSYSGQPAAELHLLGSVPLADVALAAVCQSGARLARPGEFTMRAFLAGRIDLPQAEAVLGVIDANSQRALDRALRQLAGGLSAPLAQLLDQILDLLADIEAGLDFVEDDIEFVSGEEIIGRLTQASQVTSRLLDRMKSRGTTASAVKAVLVGLPNVGKSSLFNALCDRHQAIVSSEPGTTRDYVEGVLGSGDDLERSECTLIDTAGVVVDGREADDQRGTAEQWQDADMLVVCLDASRSLTGEDLRLLDRSKDVPRLVVWTKADLVADVGVLPLLPTQHVLHVSSATGQGITALTSAIGESLFATQDDESQVVQSTAVRCREPLQAILASFQRAITVTREGAGDELLAAELRGGLDHLGQIVGAIYTDDILDRIFGRFCIGK
jgi:tRNA modification GTPase